jgi:D-lactate dehydrogenase
MSKIYFVGTCADEQARLKELLPSQELIFVSTLAKVPAEAEFASIHLNHLIDETFLESHPSMRLISTRTTSCDHIDEGACRRRQVEVRNVGDYGENSVAEHVFALMLAMTRKLRTCYDSVRLGKVNAQELRGTDLYRKTLGVIGCGRVGLHVIRVAAGFRMRVLGHDRTPHPFHTELLDFTYTSLEELLAESDIITLHIPVTAGARMLLCRERLSLCKPGAFLINTARGGLIDLEAAMEFMDSGQLGGLGLDVLEDESIFHAGASSILGQQIAERVRVAADERGGRAGTRLEEIRRVVRNHRLLQHPRVVFTPHTAYNSHEAMERICQLTARNFLHFLGEDTPPPALHLVPESTANELPED